MKIFTGCRVAKCRETEDHIETEKGISCNLITKETNICYHQNSVSSILNSSFRFCQQAAPFGYCVVQRRHSNCNVHSAWTEVSTFKYRIFCCREVLIPSSSSGLFLSFRIEVLHQCEICLVWHILLVLNVRHLLPLPLVRNTFYDYLNFQYSNFVDPRYTVRETHAALLLLCSSLR